MARVTTCVPLYLDADSTKLSAFFRYDDTEAPFDVYVHVPQLAAFFIPRDTVAAGLNRVCSPDGCSCKDICLQDVGFGWLQAVIQLPWTDPLQAWILRHDLEDFLLQTYALVPYDWDEALRRLNPDY
ncbi:MULTISPECIES: hypothetical protein [unclassified Nonomuraea]|uniref:hypothetical protein n=1 Tax=unclassified Nonomuraea TaxID=2593643 RepID=UPI0033CA26A8